MQKYVIDSKYIKDIVTDYNKLSEMCVEVDPTKQGKLVQEIVKSLKTTMRTIPELLGLSAPQIGYSNRIFVLNFKGELRAFVNPVITSADMKDGGLTITKEDCISEPNKTFLRVRYNKISVMYQTATGEVKSGDMIGVAAHMFQHHLDHLNGILLSDVGMEIDEDFDKLTDEEKQEVANMYLDALDISAKNIKVEIDNDEELKKLNDRANFWKSVEDGDIEAENVPLTPEQAETLNEAYKEYKKEEEQNE